MEESAHHRPDRQGHGRRSGEVPGRRRERLHRQAVGRGKAPLAGARMDAEVEHYATEAGREFEIELELLTDALYRMYHYDFRSYAQASLRRRMRVAMNHFNCATLSQLQDK